MAFKASLSIIIETQKIGKFHITNFQKSPKREVYQKVILNLIN